MLLCPKKCGVKAVLCPKKCKYERKVYQELLEWKQKKGRKPLILTGARQVGKTWLMQEFGRREYSKKLYVNFDLDGVCKDSSTMTTIYLVFL